jgi:hypothetical protein
MQPHIEQIQRVLAKAFRADEGIYEKEVVHICSVIGCFVDSSVYMPILLRMTQEEDLKQ